MVAGCHEPSERGTCLDGGGISLTLQVSVPTEYCLGTEPTCEDGWLSIALVSLPDASLATEGDCYTDCDTCEILGCAPMPLCLAIGTTDRTLTTTWDGTVLTPGTCGPQHSACYAKGCALPGKYVATMCIYAALDLPPFDAGSGNGPPPGAECNESAPVGTCARVPFDWPPGEAKAGVTGTISAFADGG